jgi:predicted nucleic acid-binding protein
MITAVDTSSLVAYLSGDKGRDVEIIDEILEEGTLVLPPIVFVEILSAPSLPKELVGFIKSLPILQLKEGYFERAAYLRSGILKQKLKSRLGDALIAQSCLDYNAALLSRDKDFRHYQKNCGLVLV